MCRDGAVRGHPTVQQSFGASSVLGKARCPLWSFGAAVSISSLQHRLSPSGVSPAPGTALLQHGLGWAVAAAPRGHMARTGTVPALSLCPRGRRWWPGRSLRSSQALLLPPGRGEWTGHKRGTRASWKLLKAAGAGSEGGLQRAGVRYRGLVLAERGLGRGAYPP